MFGFENLEVWQKAVEFAGKIYNITKNFPQIEEFGLKLQLRRAAVSISANISEGRGRNFKKEYLHFLNISFGSISEIVTLLIISRNEQYIANEIYNELYNDLVIISKMLTGLAKSLGFKPIPHKP